VIAMTTTFIRLAVVIGVAAALAGCATPPPPDPRAEVPYCHKSNKGRVLACTGAPAPSLNADAEAKRFVPDPQALTVFVVRRNWGDGRRLVTVRVDDGPAIETLPNTMARIRLAPGTHTVAFELDGKSTPHSVEGHAGDLRFLRIDGMAWAWESRYAWADEPQEVTRALALTTRLVADVARH